MLAQVLLIAADDPALDPTSGRGPEWGKAAPVALLIILLLAVALFVLIRSMNSQLRKVPSDFMRTGTPATPSTTPATLTDPAAPAALAETDSTSATTADSAEPADGGTAART